MPGQLDDNGEHVPDCGADKTLPGSEPVWGQSPLFPDASCAASTVSLPTPSSENGDDYVSLLPPLVAFPGRYRAIRVCGQGGGGRVIMVYDEHLRREIAMKELLLSEAGSTSATPVSPGVPSTPILTRFLREARVTSQLEHPSIVPIHELGQTDDGLPYYTMKLVRGQTLSHAINAASGLAGRLRLLPHVIDLCQAMGYAHSKGVIHRDLKPNNVMVGEFGETVVLDWGLAKVRGQQDIFQVSLARKANTLLGPEEMTPETQMGEVLGTPGYMAPEQARGAVEQVDERSDVYALGAVLYAVLAGQAPHWNQQRRNMLRSMLEEEPEPLESLEPSLPTELAAICRRAMAKDPSRRYQSAMELAEELQRFQTGSMVQAHQYGARERLHRFIRKYRAVLGTAGLALCVLLVLAGLFVAGLVRQKNETRRALYQASISLAQQAVDSGNLHQANQTLFNAPPQDRGMEWGILAHESNESLLTFAEPSGVPLRPRFSPDGTLVATPGWEGCVTLHEVRSGAPLRTLKGGEKGVGEVAFSPDGTRLASNDEAGMVRVWETNSGRLLRTIKANHSEGKGLVFAPDGVRLATSETSDLITLWDTVTGERLREFEFCDVTHVSGVDISPDSRFLAACGTNGACAVWALDTGILLHNLVGHTGTVESVHFSPDGLSLATTSRDTTILLWDLQTGMPGTALRGHSAHVYDARFLQNGTLLATAGQDNTVGVWDTATGEMIEKHTGYVRPLSTLDVSPDGAFILAPQCGNLAGLRPRSDFNRPARLQAHTGTVNSLAFSSDGTRLASAAGGWDVYSDNRVILWETQSRAINAVLEGHTASVNAVAFLKGDRQLLSGGADRRIILWDVQTRRPIREYLGHTGQVRRIALSPDEQYFVSVGWDQPPIATVWNTETGQALQRLPAGNIFDAVAMHPSGKMVATGSRDGCLNLWEPLSGKLIRSIQSDNRWVIAIAFSPDGRQIAHSGLNNVLMVHDASSGALLLHFIGHSARIEALVFSPDGKRLLTGSSDNTLRVWDSVTGAERLALSKHVNRINTIALSRDGRQLAFGGYDNIVTLRPVMPWDASAYPGDASMPFEERFEAYKRQQWVRRTAAQP